MGVYTKEDKMALTAKEEYKEFRSVFNKYRKMNEENVVKSVESIISDESSTKKAVKMATRYLKEIKEEAEKKAEREALLAPYDTMEDAKEAGKNLTKISNKFSDRAYRESESFKDLAWDADKTFPYNEWKNKSELEKAVWGFVSFDRYAPRMVKELPAKLDMIKDKFPELHKMASESWDRLKEDAEFVTKLSKHIIEEKARLRGTTAEQFLLKASKSNELSKEKQEAFIKYSMSLKNWKPAEIVGDEIYVNGKLYNEDDFVGVMIGSGNRVHQMKIYIGDHEDKETKEKKKVIYIRNHTQWYNSPLVILDLIDDIPSELLSER